MKRPRKRFFLSLNIILILFLVLVFFVFGFFFLQERFSSQPKSGSQPKVLATAEIGRSFLFVATDEAGVEANEVSFTLVSTKKANGIAVRGNPIEAQESKAFLVLNFEMENKTNDPLFLYPSDFIRLVDEEGKRFAPDFHNDVARIEPISVKKDQVAFIVPEEKNNFLILVGELDKEKEEVAINF